jgi:hypothetical protein
MIPFLSLRRLAWSAALLLLPAANSGCGSGPLPGGDVTGPGGSGGAGGAGGSGGSGGAACGALDATEIASLSAPAGQGFGEAVIAASANEVAVAYTRWSESEDVAVEVQRFSLNGAALGAPVLLHGYHVCCGQLANGGFYGALSMATDGSRYMMCWAEAQQIGCAALPVGGGDASFSAIDPGQGQLVRSPHVVHGASGWRVFYSAESPVAVALDDQAKALGAPVSVPGTLAAATTSGFAVASTEGKGAFRLDSTLKTVSGPLPIDGPIDGIATLGDIVSVVGGSSETRIDPEDHLTPTLLADSNGFHRMAAAPRKVFVGVAWSSTLDPVIRFSAVDSVSHAGPIQRVGCAAGYVVPAIAATDDAFFVAAPSPEGAHEIFYNQVYPTLRVTRLSQP